MSGPRRSGSPTIASQGRSSSLRRGRFTLTHARLLAYEATKGPPARVLAVHRLPPIAWEVRQEGSCGTSNFVRLFRRPLPSTEVSRVAFSWCVTNVWVCQTMRTHAPSTTASTGTSEPSRRRSTTLRMRPTRRRAPPTISVTQAARILGISRTTAYKAVRDGTLPSIRIRGRIVISVTGLTAVLNGRRSGRRRQPRLPTSQGRRLVVLFPPSSIQLAGPRQRSR